MSAGIDCLMLANKCQCLLWPTLWTGPISIDSLCLESVLAVIYVDKRNIVSSDVLASFA